MLFDLLLYVCCVLCAVCCVLCAVSSVLSVLCLVFGWRFRVCCVLCAVCCVLWAVLSVLEGCGRDLVWVYCLGLPELRTRSAVCSGLVRMHI